MNQIITPRSPGWIGLWHFVHFDRDGNPIFEETNLNILHDQGEEAMLSAYFATAYSGYGAPTANQYLGLDNRGSLAEGDTLAVTGEPSTFGYARQALISGGTGLAGQDWVVTQPAAAYQVQSKQVTFSASGGTWGPVTKCFLASTIDDTGKLIASVALSQSRTLNDGESLKVDLTIALSE